MDINKIADQIAAEEDFKSRVYIDTQGFPTIGFGEKLSDKEYPVSDEGVAQARKDLGNPTVTKEEAKAKMIQYIKATAIPDAQNFIGEDFNNLSPQVQTATVSLAYNVGGGGINQFSALRDSLKNNDLKGASQSLMGSLAGVQALFRYAEIIEKSFGKENMPTPEELKANPRAAELLNFIHGRKVLGKSIPKVFEQYIDNDRIEGATVIDSLPENLQQIYNANGGGTQGAKAVQQELGVEDDGIIGPGTLRKALEDERRGKAGSYSKQEIEEDEVSFNVPEEEKEEPSFFDSIKDFFGMSAEASDVPPVETLEQPQEEVPMMSPTDAMRAQSQGRVVLDSAQSTPTNPEAGPSDTVPAMLTPGEAVIPAAAAQDPQNIPVIEKMIDEGRAKNRMAEANGIPVNGKEAVMYDDAELDAYHKRNLTGKYGGGEQSLQGFAGGVMEVPSMMMMAPPKDPAMDQMEKLAVKQMGYEQKSKNRTRDTIEKIGLKHLEDTADANMKQAALDETMANYGMEVPMPMQEVPQGFQQGSGDVSYTNPEGFTEEELYADRPGLGFFQSAAGGPATMTDISDSELSEIANFGRTTIEQQTAQRELARRMSQVPMGSETVPIEASAPIKVAGSDITIAPPKPVETKTLTADKPKTIKTPENGKTPPAGSKTSSKFFEALKGGLGNAFKKVFDAESIATAGIYYGVNKLLGYDNDVAARQAAMGYVAGQKERQQRVDEERLLERQQAKDEASLNKAKLAALEKRRESAISNQIKLDEYGQTTLRTALSDTGLDVSDSPTLVSYVSSELSAVVDQFGLDLSDPADFRAAQQLIPSVMQKFVTGLKGDASNMAPGAMSTAVDRVMLQRRELGDAFEGVTPKAAANVFGKIKNNIARERRNSDTGFVNASFEDRVSHAYNVFNQFTPEQLNSLGLRAPSEGENTFTVFLEKMLANKKGLMNVK